MAMYEEVNLFSEKCGDKKWTVTRGSTYNWSSFFPSTIRLAMARNAMTRIGALHNNKKLPAGWFKHQ